MGLKSTWRHGNGPGTGTEKMVSWNSCCLICLVGLTMAGFSFARPSYNLVGEDTTLDPVGESYVSLLVKWIRYFRKNSCMYPSKSKVISPPVIPLRIVYAALNSSVSVW